MENVEGPAGKNIFKEYLELIDFPLLFNFLKAKSKPLIEKLFYSENVTRVKPAFKLPASSLAIVFLLISFLSLSSILLPLSVAKINSSIQKSNKELPTPEPSKIDEEIETAKKLEVTPSDNIPVVNEFKLVVPKLGLESNISPNVDLQNESVYRQELLSTGVAHARGSYLPGQKGSVFLFAHSTDTIFNIAKFNAKFFSLGDLETGDEIQINYQGKEYHYKVSGKNIIDPNDVELIRNSGNSLMLMTCTPPGTDWQRLIIFADQTNNP